MLSYSTYVMLCSAVSRLEAVIGSWHWLQSWWHIQIDWFFLQCVFNILHNLYHNKYKKDFPLLFLVVLNTLHHIHQQVSTQSWEFNWHAQPTILQMSRILQPAVFNYCTLNLYVRIQSTFHLTVYISYCILTQPTPGKSWTACVWPCFNKTYCNMLYYCNWKPMGSLPRGWFLLTWIICLVFQCSVTFFTFLTNGYILSVACLFY